MIEVTDVSPLKDYRLLVTFDTGERKIFDVSPFLERGVFRYLQNESIFNQVTIQYGAVTWFKAGDTEIDLDPHMMYQQAIPWEASLHQS